MRWVQLDHALLRRLVVLKLWQARDSFDPELLLRKVEDGRAFDWDDLNQLAERSRLQKGTKPWDKVLAPVVAILGPLAIWCVAAWDVRVHWPPVVSIWWSAAAFAVCTLGCLITFWAMVTNPFFSATVRIQEERGHKVIDGGPYRYVRHPGYCGALAFSIASPVALGSWFALIPAAFTRGRAGYPYLSRRSNPAR